MKWVFRFLCALFTSVVAAAADAPVIDVDANGMIRSLVDWPRDVPCRGGIWIVCDNWRSIQQQWDLRDVKHAPFESSRTIDGHFVIGDASIRMNERITSSTIGYRITASRKIDVTAVNWCIEIPVERFAGGSVRIDGKALALPTSKPDKAFIGIATAASLEAVSADGSTRMVVTFNEPRELHVQDARVFGDERYQLFTPIAEGSIAAETPITLEVKIEFHSKADMKPAIVDIDSSTMRNTFEGFGGNFVYAIDDPTTELALDRFRLAWARIGMEAAKWEPENDNGDPQLTNRSALEARDIEGSALRRRFELDRRLYERSEGRMIVSLWYPPEWLFETPLPQRDVAGRIPAERWDELVECITSYLEHLKTRYGVEPMLFSFNESDLGIYVLLNGDEMRDLVKRIGTRFEAAGLKTKILLGDSADLDKGLAQIRPTLDDAEARRFIGALAYHPWNGQNEWWDAWATAAQAHALPLMATEMGADPTAWRDGSYNSPLATLRLARRYVEQLRDAKTQALLEWEWTGDYAVAKKNEKGELDLTQRGRFLQQLTQTTPAGNVLATRSDSPSLFASAVLAEDGRSAAIHFVNQDSSRVVDVRGIPEPLRFATLFVIDPLGTEHVPVHIETKQGACRIELPAGTIATLAFPPME